MFAGNGYWPQRPPNPHECAPGKQQNNNLSKEHVLWMIERRSILQRSLDKKKFLYYISFKIVSEFFFLTSSETLSLNGEVHVKIVSH